MFHHLLALDKYITLKLTIFLFLPVGFNSPIVSCDSREVHCDPSLSIALGVSGVGGTVLANTNMGYWSLHRDNDGFAAVQIMNYGS